MSKFNDMTISEQSIVKENSFIGREMENTPLPKFNEIKSLLPQPVFEGHEDYINCYWKAWEIAFSNLVQPIENTGFVSNYIDTAFNGCLFMWDSCFIVMFGKYADRIFKFQNTLDNFYSHQHSDGFICREIIEKTGEDRFDRYDYSSTGPAILAWCEWEYYLQYRDKERLSKVFSPLIAYHRWFKEHFTWPDGTYFSSGWGCGMDNLPRLQSGYNVMFSHGHMIWADICMQQLNECNVLIEISKELNREEFIKELEAERDLLNKVINEKLWDEKSGFYYDLWKNGEHNMVRHIGAYWSLLAQCVSEDRISRFIAYLEDEQEFKTPNRIPALSKSNKHYQEDGGYWCGGVWAPTNYMVLKGLDKYNQYKLAHEIACNYLSAVVEVFKDTNTVFENYAPEFINNGKPSKGLAKADFVGWTGLAPISILFEYVFGIKPDVKNNKIIWHINLLEKHGVKKYPFGKDGELTLICEQRNNVNEEPKITAYSNTPVVLEVYWGEEKHIQSITREI